MCRTQQYIKDASTELLLATGKSINETSSIDNIF